MFQITDQVAMAYGRRLAYPTVTEALEDAFKVVHQQVTNGAAWSHVTIDEIGGKRSIDITVKQRR
ncbi:hypothetical protein E4665_17090 [Sporolactobacillus shoreae]|uniref:Uncharacterized protein n=1 Tax=Sporolactobacillus shoreae TaxID=1465501 RepID=A0A4Z0GIF5_9BACL|nr:hypothetical protein [Sporolactobacillus shoreae]TGA95984.1 hypothetical protein E4665_17090 [Sporolactobacillus shoreae]